MEDLSAHIHSLNDWLSDKTTAALSDLSVHTAHIDKLAQAQRTEGREAIERLQKALALVRGETRETTREPWQPEPRRVYQSSLWWRKDHSQRRRDRLENLERRQPTIRQDLADTEALIAKLQQQVECTKLKFEAAHTPISSAVSR